MSSSQKIILVTGSNSGVGYSVCKITSQADASYHLIMAARNQAAAETAATELRALPGCKASFSTVQLDQLSDESIEAAAAAVTAQFGRVDVLINNAAVAEVEGSGPTRARLERTLMTNAAGPALVAAAFLPLLEKSGAPYVVNVSSGLGSFHLATTPGPVRDPSWLEYRMSKAALDMLTVRQQIEWGEGKGFKVFAFCPGLVVSNLRGKDEESRQAWGHATDPDVSGQTMLSVIQGKRDADAGKFVHKDGVYAW